MVVTHGTHGYVKGEVGNLAWLFVAKGLRLPLGLMLSAMLARVLQPEGLGVWAMVLAGGTLLHSVLLNWTQIITQRFGRLEWLRDGHVDATWAARWPLLGIGFLAAIALVAVAPAAWPQRLFGLQGVVVWMLLPVLAGLWLMAECQGLQQVTGSFARLSMTPVTMDIGLLLVVTTVWLFMRVIGWEPPLIPILMLFVGVSVIGWSVATISEWRRLHLRWRRPDGLQVRGYAVFAWPLIPGFLIGYISDWGDQLLIRYFFAEREVGLFQAAYQYLLLLIGFAAPLGTVLLPRLAGGVLGDEGAVNRYVERLAPLIVFLWLPPIMLIVAIMPEVFAWLFGTQFAESNQIFRVLLVAVPGAVFTHVYAVPFAVQGRLGRSTVVFGGLMSVANVGLSLVLLPQYGVLGAAIASAVSYLVVQALYLGDQHRYYRLPGGAALTALIIAQGFGVGQTLMANLWGRIALAMVAGVVVILGARSRAVVEPEVLDRLLPARAAWLGQLIKRVYCGSASAQSVD